MNKLTPRQYGKILYELTKDLSKKDLEKAVKDFFDFVVRDQAVKKIDAIVEEYTVYARKQEGEEDVTVVSAFPLTQDIIKEIKNKFGEKININHEEDSTLLGGLIIKTEDKIFDASLRGQLQKMREQI